MKALPTCFCLKASLCLVFLCFFLLSFNLKAQDIQKRMNAPNNLKTLAGGWYGSIEDRSVFIRVSDKGAILVELNGGIHDFYFFLKEISSNLLVVQEIHRGMRFVSGPDFKSMSDEAAEKLISDLYSHQINYHLEGGELNLSMDDEPISVSLKKCENDNCQDVKPDNMRFSNWLFKFELVRVQGSNWESIKEDKSEFLTLAMPVDEVIDRIDKSLLLHTPGAPGLRAEDVEYLHTTVSDGAFNLLVDSKTKLSTIASSFQRYRIAFPETRFYVVGVNQMNETVRRIVKLDDFLDSTIDVSSWSKSD